MTYDHLRDLAKAGRQPAVAVHAVEDSEGRVLYDDVAYGDYEMERETRDIDPDIDPDWVAECVALFACTLAHRDHARS